MICNNSLRLRCGIARFHSLRPLCREFLEPGSKGSYRLVSFPEPDPLTPRQAAFANSIFAKPARFMKSIQSVDQLTGTGFNEIAFVGRSNVGKSTLINRITNNSKLVKTSSKPGHTQALNLFNVAERLTLVDMPGYGFRSQTEWGDLILSYLGTRKELKRLFIVIDPIAGIKDTDKQIMKILDQQPLSYQIVLTKRDRMTDEAFNKAKAEIEQYLVKHAICCYPELLSTGMRRKSKSKAKDEARYEDDITRVRWSILKAAGIKPKGA